MTRYFKWNPVIYKMTDHEIIVIYWMYWYKEVMRCRPDKALEITPDECIMDFRVVHWAEEITESEYDSIKLI